MEKSVIESLEKLKSVVTSYGPWMSRKMEEIFLSAAHYCTCLDIKNTHIWMPYTTITDGVSLSLSDVEVMENFGLEAKIKGLTSDGGGNLRVCR